MYIYRERFYQVKKIKRLPSWFTYKSTMAAYRLPSTCFLSFVLWVLVSIGSLEAQKDCTGVECPLLENCIEEVLESDACCASCLQQGCTCEGYQYYDCIDAGFRNGKVPEGESYFVDFGSTECSCPAGGGKISCHFIPCPELPQNCIEVLELADGCPECARIGCLHVSQKYEAGHTFHMPPCKICHCPNTGGDLMCYPLPDCDPDTYIDSVNPTAIEGIEPERHYDDTYSYDQEAPDGNKLLKQTYINHKDLKIPYQTGNVRQDKNEDFPYQTGNVHQDKNEDFAYQTGNVHQDKNEDFPYQTGNVHQDKNEDYDYTESYIALPAFFNSVLPTKQTVLSVFHLEPTQQPFTTTEAESEGGQEMNEVEQITTKEPEPQEVMEAATLVENVQDHKKGKEKGEPIVEDMQTEEERAASEHRTDQNTTIPSTGEPENIQFDVKRENGIPLVAQKEEKIEHEEQDESKDLHNEAVFPTIRFSLTSPPPLAFKEDNDQVPRKQPQTLYHYHPEEEDTNSIHIGSRLQVSAKGLIETCCVAGQQWAAENGQCADIPVSDMDTTVCRVAQKQCCVVYLKENSCVAGMIAAKEGEFCVSDDSDTCGTDSYKQCCDCCSLGLKVRSEGQICESYPNLGYLCNQVFLACCGGEDHLVQPTIKAQPTPQPTPEPERVSENKDHKEAFSVNNKEVSSNILPEDDLDECLLYPNELCQHLCINTVGSFECDCLPGYILQPDGQTCLPGEDVEQNLELSAQFTEATPVEAPTLETLAAEEDKCKDNGPCQHQCAQVREEVNCFCFPGYTIMADGVSCEDINECIVDAHNCSRRELCVNTVGSFECISKNAICEKGFILNMHRKCVDINECLTDSHSCKPGERCMNTIGSFTCLKEIVCDPGYEVVDYKCVDINECMSLAEPCKPGYNCINTVGSYNCQRNLIMCNRGYHASSDGTRCIDVDECQTGVHHCGEQQICQNLPGAYRCNCRSGYQYDLFSKTCVDINECWRYPGRLCAHTCENTPGSYRCSCTSGFRLANDKKNCEDINECEKNQCSQECANVYGSYHCYCKQGYQLTEDGHSCKDIDECTQSLGNLCTFRCVNVPGSYQCACPEHGYRMSPNGRTCKDIDECAIGSHNCSSAETCYNIQGGFRCLSFDCPSNYRRVTDMRCERITCIDYVDCQTNPVRITYYQISFPTNIMIPANIFRIGPSPAYPGDNIILTILKGNEENYFNTRKMNHYTGIVYLQRQVGEPKDFLLDVEMKLWRQGTFTTFLAKIYVFITAQAL
ncbi:fibulin-2 isoform X2 [Latimeria chalumnae]|uniref:fibulin-2 isoform X2 n=1 Tax=Latimeria chalumnae TaxID=7897 RepID=UPI00313C3D5E